MKSRTDPAFWAAYHDLPANVRKAAREKYELFRQDPRHPSLRFKQIAPPVWSIRITRGYRVLGRVRDDEVIWFWIGTHAEYDRHLRS